MNTVLKTICGIIEHRGRTIAAYVPTHLLTFDACSYAIVREEYLLSESLNLDYTTEEQQRYADRARFLNQWVATGCTADVPFGVDLNLFLRTSHLPATVTFENVDAYLDCLLSVSETVSVWQMDEPQFAIHNIKSCLALGVTDNPSLRNAKRFPGPNTVVIETTSQKIEALIAIQLEMAMAA